MAKRKSTSTYGVSKKRRMTNKVMFTPQKPIHKFQRGYQALTLDGNVVHAPYLQAFETQLGFLPGFTEFTSLYDEYRIDYVQYKFYLKSAIDSFTTGNVDYPVLHWAVDNDDAGIPTTLADIQQHSNAKTALLTCEKPVVVGYKPSVAQEIYRTPITTAYASKQNVFVDTTGTNVPHYGLKWGLDSFINSNMRLQVQCRVWLSARGAK